MTGLPFNLFDVLIRLNGQAKAAFETTAFQDIAPAFGGHALAEAVFVTTLGVRWLVGTLTHDSIF
jgi:hypothetical protein